MEVEKSNKTGTTYILISSFPSDFILLFHRLSLIQPHGTIFVDVYFKINFYSINK